MGGKRSAGYRALRLAFAFGLLRGAAFFARGRFAGDRFADGFFAVVFLARAFARAGFFAAPSGRCETASMLLPSASSTNAA